MKYAVINRYLSSVKLTDLPGFPKIKKDIKLQVLQILQKLGLDRHTRFRDM